MPADETESSSTQEEDEFVVEKILDMKRDKNGKRLVYIKWKGYPESENSWEPEENCLGAIDLIKEFEEHQKHEKNNRKKHEHPTAKQCSEKWQTIEIPDDGVSPRGFDRGLLAERIIGATTDKNGELLFLMKW